ncbi:MAG: 3-deoxy-D-manno-octulosonic acid transferase [Ferruginibacter sp.]
MMLFLHNLSILLYKAGIWIASWFNPKAKAWLEGRKDWRKHLKAQMPENKPSIWVHCASLGEFEQGRNLIETLKNQYPQYTIVLSFFSPSGYTIRKEYAYADVVCYLPRDTAKNAQDFIDIIQPALVVFVKYEFWHHYLQQLHQRNIPVLLISAVFKPEFIFFKWYGGFYVKMLAFFNAIFVQDQKDATLLKDKLGITESILINGDTRYDRVLDIKSSLQPLPIIDAFVNGAPVLVAGSTWLEDEKILQQAFAALPSNWKLIIAPHELGADRIAAVEKLFPDAVKFSSIEAATAIPHRVLIIDNIGMLSTLYSYGKMAFVGGGFQRGGIHNILEPAVFGLPIIIGPVYKKFNEAVELVEKGYCFSVKDANECAQIFVELATHANKYDTIQAQLLQFTRLQGGATNRIVHYIKDQGFLKV